MIPSRCLSCWIALLFAVCVPLAAQARLNVVVTCSSYRPIAEYIGGEHVEVVHLVEGYQDPHIVRPKPSLAMHLASADLFVATGLDLEMWAPALVDQANNPALRSGEPGYVAASAGLQIAETPSTMSRAEGDVHVFGNPHIHTSPLNGKVVAENICTGLKRIDPDHAAEYDANLARFKHEIDVRLFGEELVSILGSKSLCKMAAAGNLMTFLEGQEYKGRPLVEYLGGWMGQAAPLRGRKIIAFHKNWSYFTDLFGLQIVGYMEPKPGIPPSPGHITDLVQAMADQDVRVMLAANYFDTAKVQRVAEQTGAVPVIVALAAGGQDGMDDFFDQFDIWIGEMVEAFAQADAR
jgi:zinc/manganese transport system substrate-binding protein